MGGIDTMRASDLLGKGLYAPAEAARLVGISPARARRWIKGYEYVYPTTGGPRRGASPPVVSSDLPIIGSHRAVSFTELVEILVVHALLQRGVTLRTIRRAHRRAIEKLRTPHPFASEKLRTDGKGVFMELAKTSDEYKPLLEMASGQYVLPKIVDRYLQKLDFHGQSLLAMRWWPLGKNKPIVLDPSVAFGAPVVAGTRVLVRSIVDAIRLGESLNSVCGWFDLRPAQVAAAMEFARRGKAA